MDLQWLIPWMRSKNQRDREVAEDERDASAREQIHDLLQRKAEVEKYLIPRQRRNHWQEAIREMIKPEGA